MRLNDALIANEKYRGEPTADEEGRPQWPPHILWDDELQGFGVRVYPPVRGRPSRKDFIVTWKLGLRTRTMAIGTYGPACSLRQARKMARDAIDLARRGQDPIEARHRALGIGTPEDLASRFLFEHNAAKKKPGVPGGDPTGAPLASPESAPDAAEPAPTDAAPSAAEPEADAPGVSALDAIESADSTESSEAVTAPPPTPLAEPIASASPVEEVESPHLEAAQEEPADGRPADEALADEEIADSRLESSSPPVDRPWMTSATARPVAAPATPASPSAPRIPEARRPLAPAPAPLKRGPTKVRLLPVPDSLYRVIEHGARESGMTIAAYLNALVEIARAAVGDDAGGHTTAGEGGPPPDETGPSIRELFAQVKEAQVVEVGGSSDDLEDEPGQP